MYKNSQTTIPNKISLRYQLAFLILLPVFLLTIVFTAFYNFQYNNTLKQYVNQIGKIYIQSFSPMTKKALESHNMIALNKIAQKAIQQEGIISFSIYAADGHRLIHQGNDLGFQDIITPTGNFTHNLPDEITSHKINAYTHHLLSAVTIQQKNIGWIAIDLDHKLLLIHHYQMHLLSIALSIIGCLLALISYLLLSKKIIHPIARLKRSMQQILRNEFETQIKTRSQGEMGIIEQGCAHLQKQYLTLVQEFNQAIEVATADIQQSLELLEEKNIDLTISRKKTEEKSRQKSEFLANMSHEIRTPMNGILGFTQILLESNLDPLQEDYVKTIHASAHDLLIIINDILDFSKMDAGKLNLDNIPLNIRNCIDEVLALNAPSANKKGLELIPSTHINVPMQVLGDPVRVKQLLNNLVSNAIKYTEHGYVSVRTTIKAVTDKYYTMCIDIVDTGMGISDDEKATLFNAYTQINNSITQRHSGSGLGLVICKKLAEQMQGKIVLTSEPSKGTTFTVTLKLAKLESYEVEKNQEHRFSKLRVICFDENPLHLEALSNGLGTWGIQCVHARSHADLISILEQQPKFDIAFINVNQGMETTIQKIISNQTTPCVLLSKWYLPNYKVLGAQAVLFKPPNIQKLHNTIESVLNLPNKSHAKTKIKKTKNSKLIEKLRQQLLSQKPEILIAEDNSTNQLLFQSWLSEYSNLKITKDGMDAVQASQEKKYAILLLDLQMPRLNGIEVTQHIRSTSNFNQNTPIILISASQNKLSTRQLKQYGIEHSIEKPIEEAKLLQLLLDTLQANRCINWNLCIEKVSGNEALAGEFLMHFVQELRHNYKEFSELYVHQDIKGIESLAHKLHGACCFTGVTQLQTHVTQLETLARQAKKITQLEPALTQLQHSIDFVIKEYEDIYQTKISTLLNSNILNTETSNKE